MIDATLYSDAACPWAYSANPALRVLEWRFREQLSWRLVVIGLRDEVSEASVRAHDPERVVARQRMYMERYGMPFGLVPKARPAASGRGCRAVVAARLLDPGSEWRVFRALQLANFTEELYLDDDDGIRGVLRRTDGIEADRIVDILDAPEVSDAYERDKAEARSAAGSAAQAQEKTSTSDGPVRFTAPSVVFQDGERTAVAGGWQPLLAYDVLLANLGPDLERTPVPDSADELFGFFHDGLTTAEAALLLADGPDPIAHHERTERILLDLVARGVVGRAPLGQDAIWRRT